MSKVRIENWPSLVDAGRRKKQEVIVREASKKISPELKKWAENKTFTILTYGCQANVRDSEIIRGYLLALGLKENDDETNSDVVIFNTCAIRENAETKIYGELGRLKASFKAKKNKIIGICGCMAQEEKPMTFIKDHFPYVNLVFGTHNIDSLYSLLDACISKDERLFDVRSTQGEIVENLPSCRFDRNKAFVNIMYGCDNFCTYCIVPYTRGKQRSRRIEDIVKEVEELVEKGYKEVTLLGQNVNAYGYDLEEGNSFDVLLAKVAETGIPRVRFVTSHPAYFKEEVFKVMAKYDNIMPSLHLPVQSGSDDILKKMNRHYDSKTYLELVDMLRKYVPDVYLTTDIIVGFPNETREDFEKTLELCKKVKFDSAFTFIFSPRDGTPASRMKDETSMEDKKKWFLELKKVIDDGIEASSLTQVGSTVEVLFDTVSKKDDNMISGYSRHNRLVHVKGDESLIGQIRKVKIIESRAFSLIGELIDD